MEGIEGAMGHSQHFGANISEADRGKLTDKLPSALKFIGLGFWQAWWMTAMCSSAVFPYGIESALPDPRIATTIATDLGYLVIVVASKRIGSISLIRGAIPAAGILFAAGTFITATAPLISDPQVALLALITGCTGIAAGNALLLALWGEFWSTLATGRVGRHLYLSFLFAFVLFFLTGAMPHTLALICTTAMPIASALILATCKDEPRRGPAASPLNLTDVPIARILTGVFLVSVVYGLCENTIPFLGEGGGAVTFQYGSMLVAGICLAALIANIVLTNPVSEASALYKPFIPLMALGLTAITVLGNDAAFVGNGFVILGIYCLDMLIMLISTDVAYRAGLPVGITLGVSVLAARLGTLGGTLLSEAIGNAGITPDLLAGGSSIFVISLLILVIVAVLLFTAADLESLYRSASGTKTGHVDAEGGIASSTDDFEAILSEKCLALAESSGLTAREVEVLELLVRGRTVQDVCDELVVARGTAKHHISNIYRKTGVSDRRSLYDVVNQGAGVARRA